MRIWVVKIGSSLLTSGGEGLDDAFIQSLVDQVKMLRNYDISVALVTSGAIAEGTVALQRKPESLGEFQAMAAVGQTRLMQAFAAHFSKHNLTVGQILLTHDDINNRRRYLNARTTLQTLFSFGTVPIVNENDTVSTEEIRFGNNDVIGGLLANLLDAECLVMLTDTGGLFTADPTTNPQAKLISECQVSDASLDSVVGESRSGLGRGGMITKLQAARLAARSGTDTFIVPGSAAQVLTHLADSQAIGTRLFATQKPIAARLRWLAGRQKPEGTIVLDDGAVEALCYKKASLLPVGVVGIQMHFKRGALVECLSQDGRVIAQGLSNFDSDTLLQIRGKTSQTISDMLGEPHDHELIHRDNLVVFK